MWQKEKKKNQDSNELTKQKQRQRKPIYGYKKASGGGINQEFGINTYTLLYIKQITTRDLLHRTENSAQYSVMPVWEKNLEESGCITDSLCCTPETNTTL